MRAVGPATQVFRLWKTVISLEKLEKGAGGGLYASAPPRMPSLVTPYHHQFFEKQNFM